MYFCLDARKISTNTVWDHDKSRWFAYSYLFILIPLLNHLFWLYQHERVDPWCQVPSSTSTLPLFHEGMFPEEKAPKDGVLRSQNFMLSAGTSNCCSQIFSKTCMCIQIYFKKIYIYIFNSQYMATGNCVDPLYQLPKRRRRCRAVPSWRHGDTVGVVAFGGCAWTNPGASNEFLFTNRKKGTPPLTTKMEPMKIEIWKVLFLFY